MANALWQCVEHKAAETEAALQRQEVAHLMRVSVLGVMNAMDAMAATPIAQRMVTGTTLAPSWYA
jgi:hypothetical protein